jgi:hypothetical protein
MSWRSTIVKSVPWLPSLKREIVALKNNAQKRTSYSQCGEDRWILDRIGEKNLTKDLVYFEVRANQPSQLSNTFLFYIRGLSGVLIEPNPRCCSLLRRYRPRDLVIQALAGPEPGLGRIFLQDTTVLGTTCVDAKNTAIGELVVPIVTLDQIWRLICLDNPSLLNVCFCR